MQYILNLWKNQSPSSSAIFHFQISGCLFHWLQAVECKLKECGLTILARKNGYVGHAVRLMKVILFYFYTGLWVRIRMDPHSFSLLDPDPGLGLSIFDFGHIFEYYIILFSTFVQALPYLPPDRVQEGFQANLRYVDKHIDVSICFGF